MSSSGNLNHLLQAPEVIHGLPATRASDIWSLGIVLYQLLTGNDPVEDRRRKTKCAARLLCAFVNGSRHNRLSSDCGRRHRNYGALIVTL